MGAAASNMMTINNDRKFNICSEVLKNLESPEDIKMSSFKELQKLSNKKDYRFHLILFIYLY